LIEKIHVNYNNWDDKIAPLTLWAPDRS